MHHRWSVAVLLAAALAGCWLTAREVEDKVLQGEDEGIETADTGVPED